MENDCKQNTNVELYRETPGDHYSPSIHVTEHCGIGINVSGLVHVMPLRKWHGLVAHNSRLIAACEAEIIRLTKDVLPYCANQVVRAGINQTIDQLTAALEHTHETGR